MRFVNYYPWAMKDSGVSVALWDWAGALVAHGYETIILHAGGSEPAASFVDRSSEMVPERPIPHAGGGRLTRRPVGLERHLARGDMLVLHEGWVTNNLVAAAAARRARVPYIVVPHGVYEPAWRQQLKPPRPVREAFERRMLDGAAAVQVFFETEEAPIRALAPRARFVVAPTGCRPATRRWIGGGGYLAWVGRFDPFHKGLDLLAQALAILPPDRRPFVRLHGYDYKGGLADFHELVARLGLKAWVKVGGVIVGEERQRFLAESDGYVLPSRWESQGLALLEALAMGVPSLVSDRSHVAPLLADRGAAAVAPIDPLRLADAILELGVRRAELSANARRVVSSEFSWDRIVADFLRQLDGLGALAGDADLARAPNAVASSPADRG